MHADRYRPNLPAVISEVIDGEAVIINLDTGSYYSVVGAGAVVWNAIDRGIPVADLADLLTGAFADAPGTVADDVTAFLDQLVAESLVVPTDATSPDAATEAIAPPPGPYAAPALEVYTDMQELILLDPVHDVDAAAGWPTAAAD